MRYPFVKCKGHRGPQRSYVVCNEVIEGHSKPRAIKLASDDEMGEISCSIKDHEHSEDNCTVFCEGCAIDNSYLVTE
jgi:hypothetical protein